MNPVAELNRRLDNLLRLGTIAEVDHPSARVRVKSGDILTGWLPWITPRAGTTRAWDPPTVDEQVLILAPTGELTTALVLTGIYRDAHPAPADDPELHHRIYPDGAVIEYHHGEHQLHAILPAGGTVRIVAPGGITLVGDVAIEGHLEVDGSHVTHNGINIGHNHVHVGVVAGGGTTGAPLPLGGAGGEDGP